MYENRPTATVYSFLLTAFLRSKFNATATSGFPLPTAEQNPHKVPVLWVAASTLLPQIKHTTSTGRDGTQLYNVTLVTPRVPFHLNIKKSESKIIDSNWVDRCNSWCIHNAFFCPRITSVKQSLSPLHQSANRVKFTLLLTALSAAPVASHYHPSPAAFLLQARCPHKEGKRWMPGRIFLSSTTAKETTQRAKWFGFVCFSSLFFCFCVGLFLIFVSGGWLFCLYWERKAILIHSAVKQNSRSYPCFDSINASFNTKTTSAIFLFCL